MKNHTEVRNPASGVYFSYCHADRPPLDFVRTQREVSVFGFGGNKRQLLSCRLLLPRRRVLVYHSSFQWYKPRDVFYDRRSSDFVMFAQYVTNVIISFIKSLLLYTLHTTLRHVPTRGSDRQNVPNIPCFLHRMLRFWPSTALLISLAGFLVCSSSFVRCSCLKKTRINALRF